MTEHQRVRGRYVIDGVTYSFDQIAERLPGVKASTITARLRDGIREWNRLSAPLFPRRSKKPLTAAELLRMQIAGDDAACNSAMRLHWGRSSKTSALGVRHNLRPSLGVRVGSP